MQLVTTMGIELTYMPIIWDWLAEQYGRKYNIKFGYGKKCELANVVQNRGDGVHFAARNIRAILQLRNIAVHNCGTDPDCVEIPTKPYKSVDSIMRRARVITEYAADLECVPALKYFNGGGAHIHTGTDFVGIGERDNYVRRMMLFVAQNPWLSWAFIGLNDNENAEPLTRVQLKKKPARWQKTRYELEEELRIQKAELDSEYKQLHTEYEWQGDRRYWERRILLTIEEIVKIRRQLVELKRQGADNVSHISSINQSQSKDHALCWNTEFKTCEFRAFEMPHDIEDLRRYLILADAICRHVSKQTFVTFDVDTVPMNEDHLRMMPLEKRIAGFRDMLIMLGLNPDDYADDEKQITQRFKWYKDAMWQKRHFEKAHAEALVEDVARERAAQDEALRKAALAGNLEGECAPPVPVVLEDLPTPETNDSVPSVIASLHSSIMRGVYGVSLAAAIDRAATEIQTAQLARDETRRRRPRNDANAGTEAGTFTEAAFYSLAS